jgi:hypothetical protein
MNNGASLMAAAINGGALYYSLDYGVSWTTYTLSPYTNSLPWFSMTIPKNNKTILATMAGYDNIQLNFE